MVIIDVGAYDGRPYLQKAKTDNTLSVYAFEPNISMVKQILHGKPDNYHIYNMVVSEINGEVDFFQNKSPQTNSILPFDDEKVPLWKQGNKLKTINKTTVKSTRLDTFMEEQNLEVVDFLKVDAQGADLQVIKSCGDKIKDIRVLQVEVCDVKIYEGCNGYIETLAYLKEHGFKPSKTKQHNQFKDVIFTNEKKN